MLSRTAFILFLLLSANAHPQVRQIDPKLLPQDAPVQDAYKNLLPVEEYARNYAAKWPYPVAKKDVSNKFTAAISVFEAAHKQTPSNAELTLLTGLAEHLAYNLDIESAYKPAVEALDAAHAAMPTDPRPQWFLAMHQCESNNAVGGMITLLAIEAGNPSLPAAFWRDYAICAQVTDMPAHAVRAYDRAKSLGNSDAMDDQLLQIARNSLKPGSLNITYAREKVWQALPGTAEKNLRFVSPLCGFSFAASSDAGMQLPDVKNGTCAALISPPGYDHAIQWHAPTLLVLTRPANAGESLQDFADAFLRKPGSKPQLTSGLPCPVAQCLEFELRNPDMYESAGGAHFFALVYSVPPAAYPGLALETPQPLPTGKPGEPQYYRREDQPHRFPGTLYVFATVDASEAIIERSKADFESLLRSIVMDDK